MLSHTKEKKKKEFLFFKITAHFTEFHIEREEYKIQLSLNRMTPVIAEPVERGSRVWLYFRAITRNDLIIFLLEERRIHPRVYN